MKHANPLEEEQKLSHEVEHLVIFRDSTHGPLLDWDAIALARPGRLCSGSWTTATPVSTDYGIRWPRGLLMREGTF